MQLGWRVARPNDFEGPDSRPLKDTFGNLQQFMTWPHFTATVDAVAITAASGFVKRAITAVDDPYSLIRSNDDIQVPRDFDTWMFIGSCGILTDVDGPARGLVGWFRNGTDIPAFDHETWTPAGATDWRATATIVQPVKKGDTLAVGAFTSVNGNIVSGRANGFFLPMT